MHCPIIGPSAISLGRPAKTVLRVAIENRATDVLQWLVAAENAPAHVGVPIPMPVDSGCAPAAVHRALEVHVHVHVNVHVHAHRVLEVPPGGSHTVWLLSVWLPLVAAHAHVVDCHAEACTAIHVAVCLCGYPLMGTGH